MDYKDKSAKYFDKCAEKYDESSDGKFVKSMYGEIIKSILNYNPKKLLDLGCGTGNILMKLCDEDIDLYGIDISPEMIKIANNNLNGIADLKVSDAENIPFEDNMFDVVVCNAAFHHYRNPIIVLNEVHRVLKKGGVLILGDPIFSPLKRKIINFVLKIHSENGDYHIYDKNEIEELFKKANFIAKDFKLIDKEKFSIIGIAE